ncbi:MAG: DNA methyltransferase, partial [Aestuariivita sp.]|nr:DNA methyltransferase [Aestuariivita sp.]
MTECNVPNRTIFCDDNLDVLREINSGCIDLIYLDPPFNKNKRFTAPIGSSAEGAEFDDIFREEDVKDEWLVTIKEDQPELYHYLNGIQGVGNSYNFAYLAYMAIRLLECHRLLKETGSIYFHCDPTMSHYLKTLMDCVFGEGNFRNEIVWCYRKWS